MNFEIGAVTPPLGINLFVASGLSRLSALRIARAAIPFALVLLVALFLVTYIPDIALAFLEGADMQGDRVGDRRANGQDRSRKDHRLHFGRQRRHSFRWPDGAAPGREGE